MNDSLSPQYVDEYIQGRAEAIFLLRALTKLLPDPHMLRILCPSTPEEKLNDTLDARAYFSIDVLLGQVPFRYLDPQSYRHLEESWLSQIKRIMAYLSYQGGSTRGAEQDYSDAGNAVRTRLLQDNKAPIEDFAKVEDYLMENYLVASDVLDENKDGTNRIIRAKAHRIWHTTGEGWQNETRNWHRSRRYTKLFYENIIDAVRLKDKEKIGKVMEAFEYSKSPRNRFLIINAFEAAIAIEFIDASVIQEVRDSDFFDLNMASVESWPERLAKPGICNGGFRYDQESAQIIYEGEMAENERTYFLTEIEKEAENKESCKVALEDLYGQSHQKPFYTQVL